MFISNEQDAQQGIEVVKATVKTRVLTQKAQSKAENLGMTLGSYLQESSAIGGLIPSWVTGSGVTKPMSIGKFKKLKANELHRFCTENGTTQSDVTAVYMALNNIQSMASNDKKIAVTGGKKANKGKASGKLAGKGAGKETLKELSGQPSDIVADIEKMILQLTDQGECIEVQRMIANRLAKLS